MTTASQPGCPKCSTPVQPTWDWCHNCGYDPEGKRPAAPEPETPVASADRGERPKINERLLIGLGVAVALVVVAIGGAVILSGETERPPDEELAVVSTTSTVLQSDPAAWSRHDAPDGSYSLEFPGVPGTQSASGQNFQTTGLTFDDGPFEYSILVIDYDVDIPETNEAVDLLMSQFASRAAVRNRMQTTFAGHPAQTLDMEDTNTGVRADQATSVIFASGRRIYWLIAAGPNVPTDAQRFFDSFVLNG